MTYWVGIVRLISLLRASLLFLLCSVMFAMRCSLWWQFHSHVKSRDHCMSVFKLYSKTLLIVVLYFILDLSMF